MKMSFHSNIMMLNRLSISESFMNKFLKKLGSIVFLFQTIEEEMKYIPMSLVATELDVNFGKSDEITEVLYGDRNFKSLKLLFSRIVYLCFPDADEKLEFNELIKRISNAEEQRNKYIHSVYWFLPENKISKSKSNKTIRNPKIVYDHVNFKDMNKFIDELFSISYTLNNFIREVYIIYHKNDYK